METNTDKNSPLMNSIIKEYGDLETYFSKTKFMDIPSTLTDEYWKSEVNKRTIENIKRDIELRKINSKMIKK